MNRRNKAILVSIAASSLLQMPAYASLSIVANSGASQVGNLVTNGSFENTSGGGPTGDTMANGRQWGTGTTQNIMPFAVPTGWTSSGPPNNYAFWMNDNGAPYTTRGSDVLPDGKYSMYFGNGGVATSTVKPVFNMNTGEVTFASPTTMTPGAGYTAPVVLQQTIPTVANPSPQYAMSFWASGEGAGYQFVSDPAGAMLGIFGFQLTNVLPGDPLLYFAVPSAPDNNLGRSFVYDFVFSPINPSLNVDVSFINWGHFDLSMYGRSTTTELVIDDVRVNTIVPEPASIGLVAMMSIGLLKRRKRA